MATLVYIALFAACILLILVIMVQNPKGGGLTSGFSSANQIGGVRKTTDFLEKATWTMAIALMVVSLGSTALLDKKKTVDDSFKPAAQQEIEKNRQSSPSGNFDPSQFDTGE